MSQSKKHTNHDQIIDEDQNSLEMNDDVTFEQEGEVVADTLKKLREHLKVVEAEKAEYLAGWQRAKADAINATKNAREEVARASERIEERVMTDLLPVLDSFAMAMGNKEVWEKGDPQWRAGVEYIHFQLLKIMEEYGVKEIPTNLGDHVDYTLHHPVATLQTNDESLVDTISKVMQKGYTINGSVVRPASVEVYSAQ